VRNGFSLPEMLTALVLGTAVAAAVLAVVATHKTVYLAGVYQVEGVATIRLAAGLVSAELRGLDPVGGDLLEISPDAVIYQAGRSLYFTCREPGNARSALTVGSAFHGLRELDPDLDSVLVYLTADPAVNRPAGWVSGDLLSVSRGRHCPGGRESLTLEVGGIPAGTGAAVEKGSPVRGVSVWEMRGYPDRRGRWWLGMRRFPKGAGRPQAIQPVLGPLAPDGVEFRYYDRLGIPVSDPQHVDIIEVTITTEISRPRDGAPARPVTLRVGLRGARGS
jgi:prepilin-type N-terminal cleavage/methylation domain-containing protein